MHLGLVDRRGLQDWGLFVEYLCLGKEAISSSLNHLTQFR